MLSTLYIYIYTLTSGCISHGSLMQQILFLPSLCPLSKGFWWESSKPAIFSQLWVHAKSPLLTHPIPRRRQGTGGGSRKLIMQPITVYVPPGSENTYTNVWVHFTRLPHATDPLFAEPVPSVKRLLVGILKASHFQPAMGSRKKSSPNSSYSTRSFLAYSEENAA